ncbi:hypothetical protein LTR50_000432 [Elasticomyces elasticus]|nr:hypothetical protein LTR50_000432 [Elasticomyces elasticus]
MRQDLFLARKKAAGSPPPTKLYKHCLELAPQIKNMLENAKIHTTKVATGYTRFLLIVITVLRQGAADTDGDIDAKIQQLQDRTVTGVNYALNKFQGVERAPEEVVVQKVLSISARPEELDKLSTAEMRTLNEIVKKELIAKKDEKDLEASFTNDTIEGLVPRLEHGNLTLVKKAGAKPVPVANGNVLEAAMSLTTMSIMNSGPTAVVA